MGSYTSKFVDVYVTGVKTSQVKVINLFHIFIVRGAHLVGGNTPLSHPPCPVQYGYAIIVSRTV